MTVRAAVVLVGFMLVAGGLSNCVSRKTAPVTAEPGKNLRLVTRSYTVFGKRYVPMGAQAALKYKAEGIASCYDDYGSRGAYGEILRKGEFYAAHTTLPMPCRVRITNLSNGKSCEARVIDRGPFTANRLIDVSYAVAGELGFLGKGLQRVRVEVVSVGDGPGQLKAED
ncbi:MAG: septal ring lytic transglycosylase RlpA family protein [Akkermansia sp.]|nr:septal ring lytic transglycosylase RlpA family protein [Akkermansia sp.]